MKILVVIANYGTRNDRYLDRVVEEYRSQPWDIDIVVLTNVPKAVTGATRIVVHQPVGDPWTFPFAHKQIFADGADRYDLFIYSEDDTLVTQTNIEAFLAATEVLREDEIAGFMRFEECTAGDRSVCTINGHFHWDPTSVVQRGACTFAYFSNEHAACYMLTRRHLKKALESGGFLLQPYEEKYDLLVTAATDPYTRCGLRKLVSVSNFKNFLVAHLPNKYIGKFGVSLTNVNCQLAALKEIGSGTRGASVLMRTETRLRYQRWSRNYFGPPRLEVLDSIAGSGRRVLSYGSGDGETERAMVENGYQVAVIPLDSVVGACSERAGMEAIYGSGEAVWDAIRGRQFDWIVAIDILHLVPDPVALLQKMRGFLPHGGSVVASVPNVVQARTVWRWLKGDRGLATVGDIPRSGVQAVSSRSIRRWFGDSGFEITAFEPFVTRNELKWNRTACRTLPGVFADQFVVRGEKLAS